MLLELAVLVRPGLQYPHPRPRRARVQQVLSAPIQSI